MQWYPQTVSFKSLFLLRRGSCLEEFTPRFPCISVSSIVYNLCTCPWGYCEGIPARMKFQSSLTSYHYTTHIHTSYVRSNIYAYICTRGDGPVHQLYNVYIHVYVQVLTYILTCVTKINVLACWGESPLGNPLWGCTGSVDQPDNASNQRSAPSWSRSVTFESTWRTWVPAEMNVVVETTQVTTRGEEKVSSVRLCSADLHISVIPHKSIRQPSLRMLLASGIYTSEHRHK